MNNKQQEMEYFALQIRLETLKELTHLGFGHVGGAMSIVETLAVLYGGAMRIDPKNPRWEDRDWLVCSKGHAGPAVYATLALKGYFDKELLLTLNQAGTSLPSHCDRLRTRGIDMSTGSLGQGFSCAVGMAVAGKLDHRDLYIYTVLGDGESQEGQVWEAAMLAGTRKLDNLIAFTDYNKMQLDGCIEEVNGLYPLDQKWRAFNWHVQTVDGHDTRAIWKAIDNAQKLKGRPSMIILDTVKGKG
ncbi:MAG: transketolase, partial [Bacillota bacterium]